MKKIILSLLLTLFSLVSFSQLALFGRAYMFYTGINDGTEVVWNEYPTKCDVLVQIENQKLTIYSAVQQVYRIVSLNYQTEDIVQYLAVNKDGVRCFVYIGQYGEGRDIGVTVEFNDLAWTYIVTPDN
jgi:hypothetical protein